MKKEFNKKKKIRSLSDVIHNNRLLVIIGGGATEAEFSHAPEGTDRNILWAKQVSPFCG